MPYYNYVSAELHHIYQVNSKQHKAKSKPVKDVSNIQIKI